jgi:hypothetical protein
VFGKAEQSQDVSFFIELTISGAIICPLIVGRIAMRPYEKRKIWANLAWIARDEKG